MKKYYCIGIKGTGMSTLAQILSDLGHEVSGYDDAKDYKFTEEGLKKRKINIYYDSSYKFDKDTIVTYSVACPPDHKELIRAKKEGITVQKYNEIVGEIVDIFTTIGVSGTHGKTTTSSIIRHILSSSIGCNYFIGAGDGYVNKENKYFVLESDEFNRHFLAYHPEYAIITNIEAEHLEIYKDVDDIRNTFEQFARQVKKSLVVCGDNEEIRKIKFNKDVMYYGFNENNDVVIKNIKLGKDGSSFDLYYNNDLYGSFCIPLFGKHMILNATAAILMCKNINIDKEQINNALQTFKNAKRRFAIEQINKTTIIDDYAHHPTEISVTLESARQKYPDKKIAVVFMPNTYSRTKDFADEFASAFKLADKVFLTEINSNREKKEDYPGISSNTIISKIENAELISEETVEKLLDYKDYIICFMSCANISHLIEKFKELLKKS